MIDGFHFGYNDEPGLPADVSTRASRGAAGDSTHLEDRLERLSLVCMAMWSLLQDKTGLTEEELLERVHTIDLMDGTRDAKATRGIARCPKCSRTLNQRHLKCLYCGAARAAGSAFDRI